jgi:molecular chaperone GrpE
MQSGLTGAVMSIDGAELGLDVDPASLRGQIAELQRELAAANHRAEEFQALLRAQKSDQARYRRQVEEQRAEQALQARLDLLVRVLPVLDEFQRALQAAPARGAAAGWVATVREIEVKLREVLESEGVQKIEALGAFFNPWEHEALTHQSSPELDDQRILAIVREGYRIGDRVLRPAQVVVARRGK